MSKLSIMSEKNSDYNSLSDLANSHLNNSKFSVPNIFGKPTSQELKIGDKSNYSCLSDLANSQLSTSKFSIPNIFNKSDTVSSKELSFNLNNLNIKPAKSVDSIETPVKISKDNWHIDLSKALKTVSSQPTIKESKSKVALEDGVDVIVEQRNKTRNILPHCIDTNMITKNYKIKKTVSSFGRVLCCNFRKNVPKIIPIDDLLIQKMKRFAFTVPSPDDIIKINLNKHKRH